VEPELVKGSNGIFDVEVDGRLVFSKNKLGRFPEPGEVVRLLEEKAKK
jgi:selenoprotein W-related protein